MIAKAHQLPAMTGSARMFAGVACGSSFAVSCLGSAGIRAPTRGRGAAGS